MLQRALAFATSGYRTALIHDSDKELDAGELQALEEAGVTRFHWDEPNTTEMQIFASIHPEGVVPLIDIARAWNGEESVNDQIRARKPGLEADDGELGFTGEERAVLGAAATKGKWFKTVSYAEIVGRDVIGPNLDRSAGRLVDTLQEVRAWIVEAPAEDDGA
jgi:hypothetical protein